MEPNHPRKKALLGVGALVAFLAVGILATQAVGAFGGHGRPDSAARGGQAFCRPQSLNESNGDVGDGCVSFHADAALGAITAYTAKVNGTGVRLVDTLTVPALAGGQEQLRRGYSLRNGDAGFLAQGPGFAVMSRNGTALTIAFPAGATVTVHDAVADWSPAGATVSYGTVKASLVLPKGSTLTQSGNTLAVQAGAGLLAFHLGGPHGPMGPGFGHPFGGPHGHAFEGRDRHGGPRGPPPQ